MCFVHKQVETESSKMHGGASQFGTKAISIVVITLERKITSRHKERKAESSHKFDHHA